MVKNYQLKNKSGERSIQNFLQEKRVEQQQKLQLSRIEHTRNVRLRHIDNEAFILKEQLASYGRGMTSLNSYFKRERTDPDRGTIWFPLERTSKDWEPRPCWCGKSGPAGDRCLHFPCRRMTSYHFIFRELPDWVLANAEESVRRSKTDGEAYNKKVGTDDSEINTKEKKSERLKLPDIEFPENMTAKEKKLKIIISRKRLQNELENKPADRCINYGKPTPVRRLQRPVRPVVRRVDVLS
ncbi:hypothetical protein ACF0H5_002976 [Mactra antiquata]